MQSEQQFEQLMLQYEQIKNGSYDIAGLIASENYDDAITKLQQREPIILNCKCMRKYLELTPEQQKQLDDLLEEIRKSEETNMKNLKNGMDEIQRELRRTQKNDKLQQAYGSSSLNTGGIVNLNE